MISRYILFDITSGLPTVITTSIEAYEQYKVYGSVIAVGVDETNLTEDALIMSTWHWTGSSIGSHSEQSGDYWVWDIPTWSYIFIAPAPVINVGDYSTLSEYRKITVYGNAVDTYWTTSFPIQLRTNTVDNFTTATIITEDMGGSYTADNIEVTSRYYYLTPYYLDDFYVPVYGATVSTGSVIPLAVETGDIGAGAVGLGQLAINSVDTSQLINGSVSIAHMFSTTASVNIAQNVTKANWLSGSFTTAGGPLIIMLAVEIPNVMGYVTGGSTCVWVKTPLTFKLNINSVQIINALWIPTSTAFIHRGTYAPGSYTIDLDVTCVSFGGTSVTTLTAANLILLEVKK